MGKFKTFAGCLGLLILLNACVKASDGDEPTVPPPPPVGKEELGFKVTLTDPDATSISYEDDWKRFKIHKNDTDFTTDCTAEAGEDVDCIIEADELDLPFWGLT